MGHTFCGVRLKRLCVLRFELVARFGPWWGQLAALASERLVRLLVRMRRLTTREGIWTRLKRQVRVQNDLPQRGDASEDRSRPLPKVAVGRCKVSGIRRAPTTDDWRCTSSTRAVDAGRKFYPRPVCRGAAGSGTSQSVTSRTQRVACENTWIENGLEKGSTNGVPRVKNNP